jgi:hypothetical protein
VYERFDVAHTSGFDDLDVTAASDGRYVLAEDAINREAVLKARIRTLETQLKDRKEETSRLSLLLNGAGHALRSYQFGNSSPDLAKELADKIDSALK